MLTQLSTFLLKLGENIRVVYIQRLMDGSDSKAITDGAACTGKCFSPVELGDAS